MRANHLHLTSLVLSIATLGIGSGCDADPIEPRLSALQERIFTPSCSTISCHGGPHPANGLDLQDGRAHESLVDVESFTGHGVRVVPGDPEASLLMRVLEGPVGDIPSMPNGGTLSSAKIDAVYEWIEAGAPAD